MADLVTARILTLKVLVAREDGEDQTQFDDLLEGTEVDDAINTKRIVDEVTERLNESTLHGHYLEVSLV